MLLTPVAASAAGSATFSLSSDASVSVGERFSVEVWVNPNGESLDTVRAYLTFPSDRAQVADVSLGSAFPRVSPGNGFDNDQGTVSIGAFAIGSVVRERAVLATVVFEATAAGTADIAVSADSRLIASGEEKANASGHVGTTVRIASGADAVPSEEPTDSAEADVTPPNLIVPYTPRIRYLEGEDALVEFGTTDDGSGIDHYELSLNGGTFFTAASPYVLSDLAVGDLFIEVKAVDRAGNERYGKTGLRVYPEGTELKPEDEAARRTEQTRIEEIRASATGSGDRLLITFSSAILAILAIIGTVLYRRRQRVS